MFYLMSYIQLGEKEKRDGIIIYTRLSFAFLNFFFFFFLRNRRKCLSLDVFLTLHGLFKYSVNVDRTLFFIFLLLRLYRIISQST